jgi:hypothetical protein
MTRDDPDRLLDELFDALAPEERPADPAFVSRVEIRIAELERYRLLRSRMARRLATDAAATAAIGAAAAFVSLAPSSAAGLGAEPNLISAGLLVMLVCWLGASVSKPGLLRT